MRYLKQLQVRLQSSNWKSSSVYVQSFISAVSLPMNITSSLTPAKQRALHFNTYFSFSRNCFWRGYCSKFFIYFWFSPSFWNLTWIERTGYTNYPETATLNQVSRFRTLIFTRNNIMTTNWYQCNCNYMELSR